MNNSVPSTCTVYPSRTCTLRAFYYEIFRGIVINGGIIRIHHECEGVIENSVPRITDWHHEACRVMTNGGHEGQKNFLSHPNTSNGFFFISFYIGNDENDVMDRRAASVRPTCSCSFFLSFPRAGTSM